MTLNVQNVSTIRYRTDCLKSDSINKHYIRHHNVKHYGVNEYDDGYAVGYTGIEGTLPDSSSHTFDIGYNPFAQYPANPVVCDKLLLFGSFKDVNTLSNGFAFDLCYDHILFDRPMLVINNLDDVSSQFGTIKYSIQDRC